MRLPLASGTWAELAAVAAACGLTTVAADPDPESDSLTSGTALVPGMGPGGAARGGASVATARAPPLVLGGAESDAELRPVPRCLGLGAEGQGLSAAARAGSRPVCIPMGGMESLNVGVAGGILMWALRG